MGINMKIHNIKSISDFTFNIPDSKGLYAITGENASGKSEPNQSKRTMTKKASYGRIKELP